MLTESDHILRIKARIWSQSTKLIDDGLVVVVTPVESVVLAGKVFLI